MKEKIKWLRRNEELILAGYWILGLIVAVVAGIVGV
jgi:hypothetical protein